MVPPVLADWHVEPDNPRHFDIELAKQKLDAAGYPLDAATGKRLDKEGKPISLRMYYPNTNDTYAKSAQFVQEWYGQLGIDVTHQSLDSDTLTEHPVPARRRRRLVQGQVRHRALGLGRAARTRTGCTIVFRCDEIGNLSDSQYCNPTYDEMYDQQSKEAGEARFDTLAKMQNLIYDEAPYDILYYDSNLDVYRNDRFAGWQNMPANGTPFFTYGLLDYTLLRDATAEPPATPGGTGVQRLRGTGQQRAGGRRPARPARAPATARAPAARVPARRCCSAWWPWWPWSWSAGSCTRAGSRRPAPRTSNGPGADEASSIGGRVRAAPA